MLPTGKAKLYWLINLFTSGHHDIGTFCKEFEQTYNFEVRKADLTADELSAFNDLFENVIVYSPFPDEIKAYPRYRSAEQIKEAVVSAQTKLGMPNRVAPA